MDVRHLHDRPLDPLRDGGPLDQRVAPPLEAALPEWRAELGEIGAPGGRGRTRGPEGRPLADGAVAVRAGDLHGRPRLAVELAVAVRVLLEVAVGAVHALLEMDVPEVHGLLEAGGVVGRHHLAVGVEHVALAVLLVDGPEHPAVAVKIGELGAGQLRVEVGDVGEEVEVRPLSAEGGALGVALLDRVDLPRTERRLPLGIHQLAVGLVVPPGVPVVALGHRGPGVHVTDHALAGRDRVRELVSDGVSRLVPRDGGVGGGAPAEVAMDGVGPGVVRRAVVGVDHVAGRAAARAVVAGVVVGPQKRQQGVEQARALEVQPHGIGPVEGAEVALAQAVGGTARQLVREGDAELQRLLLSALEDPQHVAGLADLEAREGIQELEHAPPGHLVQGGRGGGHHAASGAILPVALPEPRLLEGEAAVVVEGGRPQHGPRGHHALLDPGDLGFVAAPAGLGGRPQVAGVHEADERRALLVETGVRALGVRRGLPQIRKTGRHVGGALDRLVLGRAGGRRSGPHGVTPPAVAVGARRLHGGVSMHVGGVGGGVAADAAGILPVHLGLALPAQVGPHPSARGGSRIGRGGGGRRAFRRGLVATAANALGQLHEPVGGGGGPGARRPGQGQVEPETTRRRPQQGHRGRRHRGDGRPDDGALDDPRRSISRQA